MRSHDPAVTLTWVTNGLTSLSMISAKAIFGVILSIQLVLGTYTRGEKFSNDTVLNIQTTCYVFGVLYRNMVQLRHTENDLQVHNSIFTSTLHSNYNYCIVNSLLEIASTNT